MIVLLDQVPFIDGNDHTFAALVSDTCDLRILLGDAFLRVDDEHGHITALHRGDGTDDTVSFQLFLYLALSAQTRRVDEHILLSVSRHGRVNGVSGCSGNWGDDHSVLAQQLVNNRRLAGVRLTNNGDLRPLILFLLRCRVRKMLHHLVKHIAKSHFARRRDRNRIAETQVIKLIHIRHELLKTVHFIDDQKYRTSGTPEHIRHLEIRIHKSLPYIGQEQDHVGGHNSCLRLFPHLGKNDIFGFRLNASRVDQRKLIIQPGNIGINPVSGYSGGIFYDGNPASRQRIE